MKTDTIIRTIVLGLALVNQVLSMFGMGLIPIEDATVEALVTSAATVITAVWAWWKNNSFTKNAQEADAYMAKLKTDSKTSQL